MYPAVCSLAGLVAGMFGVGGGIVKVALLSQLRLGSASCYVCYRGRADWSHACKCTNACCCPFPGSSHAVLIRNDGFDTDCPLLYCHRKEDRTHHAGAGRGPVCVEQICSATPVRRAP